MRQPTRAGFVNPAFETGYQESHENSTTRRPTSGISAKLELRVHEIERDGVKGFLKVTRTKREAWREWAQLSEGCYLLRTNLMGWSPEDLWQTYIQLTQAESAFCTEKSELNLPPIWHHLQEHVEAHILFSFLA